MAAEKKSMANPELPKDSKHLLYLNPEEKTVFHAKGNLDGSVDGTLVLTSEKLFFYFESNISREQKFIGRYPFIKEASLNEGFLSSELKISNKNTTFTIKKMKKSQAKKFYGYLQDILEKNTSV